MDTVHESNKAVKGDGEWNPAVKDGLSTEGLKVNKTNWTLAILKGPLKLDVESHLRLDGETANVDV